MIEQINKQGRSDSNYINLLAAATNLKGRVLGTNKKLSGHYN